MLRGLAQHLRSATPATGAQLNASGGSGALPLDSYADRPLLLVGLTAGYDMRSTFTAL